MLMLNVGCGSIYHKDWINLDCNPVNNEVKCLDIKNPLPFEDASVDVCYSSHVIEHLKHDEAVNFINEQYRVLKQSGTMRIVAPDLEVICRNYLKFLEVLLSGDSACEFKYEYTMLELYDQVVRDVSGGEMLKLWLSGRISDSDMEFVVERHGKEAENIIFFLKNNKSIISKKDKNYNLSNIIVKIKLVIVEATIKYLLGEKHVYYLRSGIFRNSGEIHYKMYDRYSLSKLLSDAGFLNILSCKPNESKIINFTDYCLECIDGKQRKPDSFYLEAVKG